MQRGARQVRVGKGLAHAPARIDHLLAGRSEHAYLGPVLLGPLQAVIGLLQQAQARLAPELRIGKCLYVDGRQPFQIGEV